MLCCKHNTKQNRNVVGYILLETGERGRLLLKILEKL